MTSTSDRSVPTPSHAIAHARPELPARDAVLLVNGRSRRGAEAFPRVRDLLTAQGVELTAAHLVTDPAGELPVLLPELLAGRPSMLVVGSGDGTIASVVDHLAHSETVLGYVPLGTTNNFSRSLGLPRSLRAAVDVVTGGRVAQVDLGRVDGDYFANLVSIGISADVAGRTPHRLKRHLGRTAYTATAAVALARHRPFVAEVRSGDVVWEVVTHQLNIANGRMHAGTPIARDASLEDRLLTAYALGGRSRLSTAGAAARQAVTPWEPVARKGHLSATEFHVTTDRPMVVDVDGEVSGTTPIHVEVTAAALRVMVPRR
ncbi:diacylglycerol/lipid kinase family protein [Cellulomonas sp. NS3]|uniref:diacylglycerol/lipid kinase family protein n=1 Tax=Cellulomonas sp. NS3 TaxID=2973977 RepID=UPI0021619C85|nr:YegS/Rv2252/BmrU family lipid kinase [Cellulomonas sp. NS3]